MAPKFELEMDEIVDQLMTYAQVGDLKLKLKALKGIDWNPFNEDGDEYTTVWSEMLHNRDLIWDAIKALVNTAEKLIIGGISLSNQQKHKAVVEALDRAIRVPFYLEPFDDIVIDMLVTAAVKYFNAIGWGTDERFELAHA